MCAVGCTLLYGKDDGVVLVFLCVICVFDCCVFGVLQSRGGDLVGQPFAVLSLDDSPNIGRLGADGLFSCDIFCAVLRRHLSPCRLLSLRAAHGLSRRLCGVVLCGVDSCENKGSIMCCGDTVHEPYVHFGMMFRCVGMCLCV